MEWWEEYFGEAFCYTAIAMNMHAKKEIDFILSHTEIDEDASILDMCCGYGRHSLELAKRGYEVLGVDYSKDLIKKAQGANAFEEILDFQVGDMRNFQTEKKFDLVINLFVSIGYFATEEENEQSVKCLCDAVKDGGYIVLEINNPNKLQLGSEAMTTRKGVKIETVRTFDEETKILHGVREVKSADGEKTYDMDIRIYTVEEIKEMFEKYNVKYINHYGGYSEETDRDEIAKFVIILKKEA